MPDNKNKFHTAKNIHKLRAQLEDIHFLEKIFSDPYVCYLNKREFSKWKDIFLKSYHIYPDKGDPIPDKLLEYFRRQESSFYTFIPTGPVYRRHGHLSRGIIKAPSFEVMNMGDLLKELIEASQGYKDLLASEKFTTLKPSTQAFFTMFPVMELQRLFPDYHKEIMSDIKDDFKQRTHKIRSQSIDRSSLDTIEDINAIAVYLSSLTYIPWNYNMEYCFSRADFSCELIRMLDIPGLSIEKQYVIGDIRFEIEGININFKFHVAPMLQLPDGSNWIIDPIFNKEKGLSLEEWLSHMKIGGDKVQNVALSSTIPGTEQLILIDPSTPFALISIPSQFDLKVISNKVTLIETNPLEHHQNLSKARHRLS